MISDINICNTYSLYKLSEYIFLGS